MIYVYIYNKVTIVEILIIEVLYNNNAYTVITNPFTVHISYVVRRQKISFQSATLGQFNQVKLGDCYQL